MKPKEERQILYVAQAELDRLNKILRRMAPSPLYKDAEIVETMTEHFSDGFEIDVKICNGTPPYIDAILFKNGQELNVMEACTAPLEGEYTLEYGDTRYTLSIEPRKFYRAIFQIELLADEPIEDMSLEDIHYNMTEGQMSGCFTRIKTQEITSKQMTKRLINQGSSPEFLGLDEKGKDTGYV